MLAKQLGPELNRSVVDAVRTGAFDQHGSVRKACHSTWAGEGADPFVEFSEGQKCIGELQRRGDRKVPFSFVF
jgi:hypothetical protein